MKQHYTKKQVEELLSHMRIVCQTNEQVNGHILRWFDEHDIRYVQRSLRDGDYSFMIKSCPELGFPLDTYFTDELFIERKNSLQELAQSLYGQKKTRSNGKTEYDDAFLRELKRAINKPHKYLLVEQPDGWDGILNHAYPNHYDEKAFWGALHKIETIYGLRVKFIERKSMALEIYTICKCILELYIDK